MYSGLICTAPEVYIDNHTVQLTVTVALIKLYDFFALYLDN